MSFSNKTTPVGMIKREDNSAMEQEQILANLENFRCEFHPQFKIDALNMNKVTNTITFHCIKCIIEGDGARSEDEKLITIKELLHNCYETFERRKRNYRKSRDGVKDRLLGFLTKEYLGTFDKLLESQYDLIDKKLSGLIDKLSLVREKYREYYRTELETLKEQGSEIKEKINFFYDENNQDEEKPQYNSINEIYDQFNKISRKEELQEFLQELHLESIQRIEDVTGTDDCKRLIGITESIKAKAKNASENPPDLSSFEDLDRILENLLQPDSMAFKKSIGQIPKFNNNNIDFNTNSFGFHHSDTFGMNMENIYEENNDYYSSTSREPLRTVVKQRHYSDHDTTKKKKKIKDSSIESQALRNLRKELEKMGDMEDEKDLKPKQKLNDWINRRVTGYLIFQNSMNASNKEKGISDTGVHLNSSMGKKWKGLNEREKKDYKDLANHYRSVFKREIEEHDSEKAKDLIEMLDEKIKKVKLV